ncbi:MAG: tetratricopeptide repeat protein [Verrucomicrobia bacterium]|nr:tetratricopeptide repeat protein [Verrucomicrobiota bacterium]
MTWRSVFQTILFFSAVLGGRSPAAELKSQDLLHQARAAFERGKGGEAVALATKAIEAEPKNYRGYVFRAQLHVGLKQHVQAIDDFTRVLDLEPKLAEAYQHRGSEQFKLGHINESIADFDKYLELVPSQAPQHWQRGISLYYAGRFEDGRKQFESHQTVNPSDVENAVWHFLCVARSAGLDKARASLIPIQGDTRAPMMEIHALFAGKAKPEDVLAAAKSGDQRIGFMERKFFYAHLYLGLYYEAIGDAKLAREHIFQAAEKSGDNDYMGDVARIHAELLRQQDKR